MQNTCFLPFPHFILFYFFERITKTNQHEMHECYAMQILEKKMVTKNREMKHKDHVRKTQLNRAFYIQNFLDATLALELLFILEC